MDARIAWKESLGKILERWIWILYPETGKSPCTKGEDVNYLVGVFVLAVGPSYAHRRVRVQTLQEIAVVWLQGPMDPIDIVWERSDQDKIIAVLRAKGTELLEG